MLWVRVPPRAAPLSFEKGVVLVGVALCFVNPRRACARVTVVVLCVCLSVCLSVTALLAIVNCAFRLPT